MLDSRAGPYLGYVQIYSFLEKYSPLVYDAPEEEEYDDIGASPEHPGRSRFNMTNIVEESR